MVDPSGLLLYEPTTDKKKVIEKKGVKSFLNRHLSNPILVLLRSYQINGISFKHYEKIQIIVMKDLRWVFFSLWRCEDFKLISFGMQRSQVLRCQMRNEIKAIQCMVAWLRKRVVVDSYCTWAKVSLIRLWPSSIYIWNSNRNKTYLIDYLHNRHVFLLNWFMFFTNMYVQTKGQLISEVLFLGFNTSKKRTKYLKFLP